MLAGGDICFAPPFGNGDEEVLWPCTLCLSNIIDHSRCVSAKLMPATKTAAQQRRHWEFTKKLSESSIIVLSCQNLVCLSCSVISLSRQGMVCFFSWDNLMQVNHVRWQGLSCDGSFKGGSTEQVFFSGCHLLSKAYKKRTWRYETGKENCVKSKELLNMYCCKWMVLVKKDMSGDWWRLERVQHGLLQERRPGLK